ncbi:MAG: PAS domain S-box protein, partial [Flavobacteriales bacterium]|nr:PAS domain S-box protein [Flavobacteriales bacterium]
MKEGAYKILHLEDDPMDVEMVSDIIESGGVDVDIDTVSSKKDFIEKLVNEDYALIISDFTLPDFDGMSALRVTKEKKPRTPFILLTGTIGEERAVDSIKLGAEDYVLKSNTSSLLTSVKRALREGDLIAANEIAIQDLENTQIKLSKIIETAIDAIITIDEEHIIIMANEAAGKMFGYDKGELLNKPLDLLIPEEFVEKHSANVEKFANSNVDAKYMGSRTNVSGVSSSGKLFPIETALSKMEIGGKIYFNAIVRDITDRVKMELKLRKSEEKFKGVFDSITDIFSRVNNKGVVEIISPSVFDILGYKAEELVGEKAINYYVNPKDREELVAAIKKNGYCNNFEAQVYTKDGEIKYLSFNAKEYFDKHQKPAGIESVIRDITDKKKIEHQLKSNTELLKESQKIAKLGHLVLDLESNEIEWSDEVYRIYGVAPDVIPDFKLTTELVHPDDASYVMENLGLAMQLIKPFNIEHRIINQETQEVVWIRAQAKLELDVHGVPKILIGTILDITDRKLDEEALRRSEQEFRSIYDSSYSGIPLVDMDGRFLKTNKRFREMYGYSEKELKSMTINDITHPDDINDLKLKFNELVIGKFSHFEVETRYIKKGGGEMICNTIVSAIVGADGRVVSSVAVITDITEQKKIQEKLSENTFLLREAQRMAHLGNWEWTISRNIVVWSDELYQIYGLNKDTFKASFNGYLERVHVDDREFVANTIQTALKTGNPVHFEERVVRPDGEVRYLKSWGVLVKDAANQPFKMLGACLDVTESKLHEKELREGEEEYRTLAESAPIHIMKVDENYLLQYINRIDGEVNEEDVIGNSIFNFLNKSDHDRIKKIIDGVFDSKESDQYEVSGLDS